MKRHIAFVAQAAIVASLFVAVATGCISNPPQGAKGGASIQIQMDKVGALGKAGSVMGPLKPAPAYSEGAGTGPDVGADFSRPITITS